MANVLDRDIIMKDFEIQSGNFLHFQTITIKKILDTLISWGMGKTVPQLFFYQDGISIK